MRAFFFAVVVAAVDRVRSISVAAFIGYEEIKHIHTHTHTEQR